VEKHLRGITWGHIRAIDPLRASAAIYSEQNHDVMVKWDVRSLSAFEHQPIEELVENYDMVVFDHPYCGKLDAMNLFSELSLESLSIKNTNSFIGKSLSSYQYKGKVWGAPIDGATNHAIYRSDLLDHDVPQSWNDVIELGKMLRSKGKFLGMAASGHHGLLVIAAICANLGQPWTTDSTKPFCIDEQTLTIAVNALRELLEYCSPESCDWNSIDLHNAMSVRDDIIYCPCVYGFSVYGEDGIYKNRLSFSDFTGINDPYCQGSVLGGAAIGMSIHTQKAEEVLQYIDWLMSKRIQQNIVAGFHGQPGRIEAWDDTALDQQYNGFFSGIRSSIESSWIRPRFYGYQSFECKSGDELEECLRGKMSTSECVDAILKHSQTEFIRW
jgi:multiple sugar transport system substrate-binding protein